MSLSLWLKRHDVAAALERKVASFALEVGAEPPAAGEQKHASKLPGDTAALRGLPAIGRGVGGAIPGTDPVRELLRRERLAERTRLAPRDTSTSPAE